MIAPLQEAPPVFSVRSWEPADAAAVIDLYGRGLLCGRVAGGDAPSDLRDVAGHYLNRPQDHFWVAHSSETVIGCVGVAGGPQHVASVRRLRVEPAWQTTPVIRELLRTAVEHCRLHFVLKLVLDTHIDCGQAVSLLQAMGFQVSRRHMRGDETDVLEFYLNLYVSPPSLAVEAASAPARSRPCRSVPSDRLASKLVRALHARCDPWASAPLQTLLPRLMDALDQAVERSAPEREGLVRGLIHQTSAGTQTGENEWGPMSDAARDALATVVNSKVAQVQRILQRAGGCVTPSTWFG